ncbi:heparinase II/III family protein [Dyadobacter aurulentus]|uniref:heparinase II/III family protein n=1 Tax=Dyadobacter sp. UC 10 TaxID=2605428 RepID=UPI001788DED6|nr:heparinase II/III family protein [Dyadobacter sp. UC 10]
MKKLLILFLLCSVAQAQTEDYTTPVVQVEPLDMKRVSEIAAMLPDTPRGFGETYKNRKAWDELANSGRFEKVKREAKAYLDKPFPPFDETRYMRMFTHGDSQAGKDLMGERLRWLIKLTWAECLENKGTYMLKIEEVLAGLLTQKTWVNPRNFLERNHQSLVELACAQYAQNIAQAMYLLDDKLNAKTREQINLTIRKRMFEPILATIDGKNADHGWLKSTNNWNAVCLSGIAGTALTILPGKKERAQFVAIAERYHQNFVAGFLSDGYCTEGISYYNYGFGRFVSLREIVFVATKGKLDFFDTPKMARIAAFPIHSEIINDTYPAIADCKSGIKPSRNIVWYAAKNLGIDAGRYDQTKSEPTTLDLVADVMYEFPNTASAKTGGSKAGEYAAPLRSYFDAAGILTVRPGDRGGLGAALKGGRNNEHHNHNDVGSYTIAAGSELIMGDPGAIPYTAKTFSDERYTYKSLGSYGHPVPLVAGTQQRTGREAHAEIVSTKFSNEKDVMLMDLTSAYEVPGLQSLKREFTYLRGKNNELNVSDEIVFDTPQRFETPIVTRSTWEKNGENRILLTNGKEKIQVTIDTNGIPYDIENEEISEEKGEPYTRLAVRLKAPVRTATVSIRYAPVTNP